MVGLLLLFLPAIAQCAPTLSGHGRDVVASGCWLSSPEETKCVRITADITGLAHSQLAAVAGEFHKHPVISADTSASANGTKSFPPVPSGLLMVLTGFVCISLVRDCRVWLTALTCLLWAGQTGLSLLPQLALCLAGERHREQPSLDCVAGPRRPVRMRRRRSEIEGTYYAGLLRHLAGIPDRDVPTSFQAPVRSPVVQLSSAFFVRYRRDLCCNGLSVSAGSLPRIRADRRFRPLQSIIGRRGPFEVSTVNHLPLGGGPVVRLATVVVRTNLARGPPSFGRIAHLLYIEG